MKYKIYICPETQPELYQQFMDSKLKRGRKGTFIRQTGTYKAFYIITDWDLVLVRSMLTDTTFRPYWYPARMSEYVIERTKEKTRAKYLKPPATVED